MTAYLLHSKLCAPPPRPDAVPRPHLFERLNQGLRTDRRLILLSAPAGFGKTTLLVHWLRQADSDVAWLSLDEGDNDPTRFQSYLLGALQELHPDLGLEAQAMLQAPQPPPSEAILTSLLNDIGAPRHAMVLVLDDYHLIHSLPIHEMLAFVLAQLPAHMHLAISTREDPPLPLPRLRARAQMIELRQVDLRFTPQETARFFRETMCLDLADAEIAALQQRTEGWVTGLQLAALSLQGTRDRTKAVHALTGSHRYILDYLIEEVFGRQSPEIQQFLLDTSILHRLTAPLCNALTGRTDGHETLLALERSNLFLYSLDISRQWYRYHRLFAELLAHRLRIECSDRIPALHRQASQWYAEYGYPADAIRHALSAGDWESTARLLEQTTEPMLNQGEVATLLGWYRALPEATLRSRPKLCYEYSWLLILTEQIGPANEFLALAEAAAKGDPPAMGQIAVARAHLARLRGDGRAVVEYSHKALSLLAEEDWTSRAVAAINVGIANWYHGRLDEAARSLSEAWHAAARSGNDYLRISALVFLARLEAARSRLRQAAESCQQLIQSDPHSPTVALARVDLAKILIEWNELAAAAEQTRQSLDTSRRNADPEIQLAAAVVLAYIRQCQGQESAAQEQSASCAQMMQHPGLSPFARLHALGYRALAALAAGDLDQAARCLEHAPPLDQVPSVPEALLLCLAQARLHLAQGERAGAARALSARHALATRTGFRSSLVQTHAMLALCSASEEDAADHTARALSLGRKSGHVRAFLDLGQPMVERLQWAVARGIETEYASVLLAAHRGVQTPAPGPVQQAVPAQEPSQPLVEPLSEREIAVLRLLAQNHTYQEASQALFVSHNTIKTHAKHIYAKLQVHTRRQAAAKARELGLL